MGSRGDLPGGPVVKTSPSNAGSTGLIPDGELRSHMPHGQKSKILNRSNIVTDAIKTLKTVRIKKKQQTNKKQLGHRGHVMYVESGARLPGVGFLLCYFKLCDLGQVA